MKGIIFPKGFKCLVCNSEIEESKFDLCENCFSNLPLIKGKTCLTCGEPIFSDANYCMFCKKEQPKFTKCFAPFLFQEPIVGLIYNLKYDGKKYVAETLSNLLLKYFLEKNLKVDLVVPVPLHIIRESERGFNQSELLVQSFRNAGFEICNSCLVRTKNTKTQTALTKAERKINMESAFKVLNKSKIKNKTILLVDDVYTTGATFNEISEVLFRAGAKAVYGLSLAHALVQTD